MDVDGLGEGDERAQQVGGVALTERVVWAGEQESADADALLLRLVVRLDHVGHVQLEAVRAGRMNGHDAYECASAEVLVKGPIVGHG